MTDDTGLVLSDDYWFVENLTPRLSTSVFDLPTERGFWIVRVIITEVETDD